MGIKGHIVKINEEQYKFLKGGDTKSFAGNSEVSVGGQVNPDETGIPKTTDDIGGMVTAQGYNRWPRRHMNFGESVDKPSNGDNNGDGVDDFYDDKIVDTLNNGNPNDNATLVPNTIETKVDMVLNMINNANLNAIQTAAILNKIIERIDTRKLTYKQRKDLVVKI